MPLEQRSVDPLAVEISSLGELIAAARAAFPDRAAIIDERSDGAWRTLTYRELDKRIAHTAGALKGLGLGPGDRIGLGLGNCAEYVEAFLSALRIGAVPVLLNVRQSADTLRFVIEDASCRAVIAEPGVCEPAVAAADAACVDFRIMLGEERRGWLSYESVVKTSPPFIGVWTPSSDSIAAQPYTSGSTGRPKGVLLTHTGQVWFSKMHARYMLDVLSGATLSALVSVPMFHVNAWVGALQPMLLLGGVVVILRRFDPVKALSTLSEHRLSYMMGVTAMYDAMLREKETIEAVDLSSFCAFFCGSAPGHREMLEECERVFGARAYHVYGLTEGGPAVLSHPATQPRGPLESCGKPESDDILCRLVTPEGVDGDFGELLVKNPGVAIGYHNLPDLTRARLVNGWLRTGDLMRRDAAGWFYFEGRVDDMFVCGGENIYPLEVERVLMAHPGVEAVSVAPIAYGMKGLAPAALVSLKRGADVGADTLKAFYLEHAPAYSHPRLLVIVDQLPRNATDKVDRAEVARILAAAAAERVEIAS